MKGSKSVAPIEAEQAMQQVLRAEQEAEAAILECKNDARRIIEDAQLQAQIIHTRANQRITNMEMRHGHKLDRLIKEIDRTAAAALKHDSGDYSDTKHVLAVVNKMAVELCLGEATDGCNVESEK